MTSLMVREKKFSKQIRIYEQERFISVGGGGGGAHPLHPPPRSAPDLVCGGTEILLVVSTSFQTGKKCFKKFSMKEKKSVSRLTLEASAFIDYDGYLLSCKNLQSDF